MTRVGVVGLGAMGRNHARVLRDLEGVELASVCDQDPRALNAAAREYSVPGYASWDEMFERERMDAVVVAVPTRFHRQAGLSAIEHGLHVLIEKPIAADLEEGGRLVGAARRARRILAVGHIERFNPAVSELYRRLGAGELGRIYQLQARRQGPFPARIRDVGVVIDLATHDLDVMLHLAGSEVQRLYAETEQRINTEHEDILNALLRFESGALGVLQVNWLTPTKIRELSVLGEHGLFLCNYISQELTFFKNAGFPPKSGGRVTAVTEGEAVELPIVRGEPLMLELRAFVEAVRGTRPIEVDGEAGMRALGLALAVVASASEARVISAADLGRLLGRGSVSAGRDSAHRPDRGDL